MMKDKSNKQPETLLTHSGRDPQAHFGAVNTPIFRASTILQASMAEYKRPKGPREQRYGRRGTPTTFTLEDVIADVEGGAGCVIASSGLNAIALALLSQTKAGDHVLMADCVYGPARNFANKILARFGVTTTFFDPAIGADIDGMFQDNTTVVYMEAPGSQTFEMCDVPAIAAVARKRGAISMTDNTWGTPLFFSPFAHGCDISIHAATKYIVGHSDAMLGAVTYNEATEESVRDMAGTLGVFAGPDDVYLGTRGMRTLAVRLRQHEESALAMADWLWNRPEVDRVLYPSASQRRWPCTMETRFYWRLRPDGLCTERSSRYRPCSHARRARALRHGCQLGRIRKPDPASRSRCQPDGHHMERPRTADPYPYRP